MPPRSPILLYPQPPFSPYQSPQVDPASDESEFPPCRIARTPTSPAGCEPQVDPASDESEFPPFRMATTPTSPAGREPQADPASDESEFPPFRIATTPSRGRSELQSPLQLPTYKRRRLGRKNILNTIHATVQRPNHQNVMSTSSKRSLQVGEDPTSLKRQRRQSVTFNKDDMDWVKNELGDIRDGMEGIMDEIRENVNFQLSEIIYRIEELRREL